ncbi:MAG: RNA methyltransferase [Bacteroidales bacterium]|jgi:tRNA (guanosine-2'-O-)-methyltransferase|nr:RNA methyltransferase [Bacteroidales bacterium]
MIDRKLIEFLSGLVTGDRLNTFNKVLEFRTRYITVVLEDLFQSHNASAVLRSCDCFGIQDIHMIENNFSYSVNPDVSLGSAQWLSISKYKSVVDNTLNTIKHLRNKGYRIVATTPHTNDTVLEELDLEKGKIALLFGSELPGLSDIAMNNADEFVKINMVGFTESFNISVSAAICLYELSKKLRLSCINWHLRDDEKNELLLDWLKTSIKDSENIIKLYYQRQKQ